MRHTARTTGAALALATALLVGGCGSGDDGGSSEESAAPDGQEQGGEEKAPDEAPDAPVTALRIQGGWTTGAEGGSPLILVVAEQQAVITGESTCVGEVVDNSQPATLDLQCEDGSSTYAKGTIESFDGEQLTVSWASGTEHTFTKSKAAPGELPDPNGPPGTDDLP